MYPNVTIPEPEAFHMARWDTNTIYRGSYSNWPPSFVNGHAQNLRANVGKRLWFAGEATSLKYFGGWKNSAYCGIDQSDGIGTMHGAYFEGQEIASLMALCIKGGSCEGISHVEDVKNAQPYSTSSD